MGQVVPLARGDYVKFNRVVVIAPTRSTCLNISMVLQNGAIPGTLLIQEKGKEIFQAVDNLEQGGFGVVAGTGTGKTVAIRDIAKRIVGEQLSVDVVTRENEATDYTWNCNVLVVTPGVALHWFKNHVITATDLVVVDEIHQTSEHLELSLALSKRNGNTVLWMSATIDPQVYQKYLNASTVIKCSAFDPARRATVEIKANELSDFLDVHVTTFVMERRGVAVFVPTRAMAEQMAKKYGENATLGITCDFYHGGEKVEKLRQFLKGDVARPFMIFMTSAGASSLNISGLDTVIIVDSIFKEVIHSGVAVLEKTYLGNNDLLQMGGRVNGRALGGKIFILSHRHIDFHALEPKVPEFVLGGDLQHVALVCARLGVNLSELDLITSIDRAVYNRHVSRFKERGVIAADGTLTTYGRQVEHLPVTPAWAEVLVHAQQANNPALLYTSVVAASAESLYSLLRKNAVLTDVAVRGSDNLTAYNIVAVALAQFGYISQDNGDVGYGLRGDYVKKYFDKRQNQQVTEKGAFVEWCDQNGFNGKAIKEVTLAIKSIFRQMDLRLPHPSVFSNIEKGSELAGKFIDLLAKVQSLDFVRDERNSDYGTVWAAQHSQASALNAMLGTVRFWTDKRGCQRASVEGTEIPEEVMNRNAKRKLIRLTRIGDGSILNSEAQTFNHGILGFYSFEFAGVRVHEDEQYVRDQDITPELIPAAQENFLNWLVGQMTI